MCSTDIAISYLLSNTADICSCDSCKGNDKPVINQLCSRQMAYYVYLFQIFVVTCNKPCCDFKTLVYCKSCASCPSCSLNEVKQIKIVF